MAVLSAQKPGGAASLTYTAAAAGGDEFLNSGKEFLHVRNGSAAAITVTANSIAKCDQGFDHDKTETVPAGEDRMIGPFATARYNNANGRVEVTYSAVTTVTVALLSGL